MATRNPACTNAAVVKTVGGYRAVCGCDWTATGFPSKTKAKRAHAEHRFGSAAVDRFNHQETRQ